MAEDTGISWTDHTWNPIVGCSLKSPGCTNCYAMKQAHRLEALGSAKYAGLTRLVNGRPVWTGAVRMADEKTLDWPLRKTKPSLIFVNSMSDLWHEALSPQVQFRIVDVMAAATWHRFQVLTKRADVMVERLRTWMIARDLTQLPDHIWWGVSVEDQKRAEEWLPLLATIPAKVRFLSMEPLLAPVDLTGLPSVEWYIVGGESVDPSQDRGSAAAFDPAWARLIRAQARAVGGAFHFKQLGCNPTTGRTQSFKGDRPDEWPEDLRVQEWPGI